MIGQTLGSYLIQEKVGAGAMGVVYRALHEPTGKVAAVKIITGDASSRGVMSKRFEREAMILRGFDDDSIVRFYAWGKSKGTHYLALEYLSGGTLEELLIEREIPLPWEEAVTYSIQICKALQYAHEKQIIHRDLKPSNLMFTGPGQSKGTLKLTDFGIVKDLDENAEALTATGRTLGTAAYMAPEQIRGNPPVGPRTDLYALGCMMFQMLTGEIPFRASSPVAMMNQHLSAKRPLVSDKGGEIPVTLNLLIRQMMSKERDDRPRDALLVGEELKLLLRKSERGESVEMVFAGGAPARLGGAGFVSEIAKSAPSRASAIPAGDGTMMPQIDLSGNRPTKPMKGRTAKFRILPVDPHERSERIKTIGLFSALVVTIALIAYVVWPASAKTLYSKAEALMASANYKDWNDAERLYLTELDRRFPALYFSEKKAWRERIELAAVRRKAAILEKPNLGALSQPKPGPETTYVSVFNEATGSLKDGRDEEAVQRWRDMAEILLKTGDPLDHAWGQLAEERAQSVLDGMEARRKSVEEMLDRADKLNVDGKTEAAIRIHEDVIRRFGSVQTLQDLIQRRTGMDPKVKLESNEKKSK